MRICDVDGCGRKHDGHGYCHLHLQRVRATGSIHPTPRDQYRKPPPRPTRDEIPCPAEGGCGKPAVNWAGDLFVCMMHASRWRRNGHYVRTRAYSPKRDVRQPCSVAGCTKLEVGASLLCKTHYTRNYRHGDPTVVVTRRGSDSPQWVGDDAAYATVHARVRSARGRAKEHLCTCGARADQWSYDHSDPAEKLAPEGAYSTDITRYRALCYSCHKRFDLAIIRGSA